MKYILDFYQTIFDTTDSNIKIKKYLVEVDAIIDSI